MAIHMFQQLIDTLKKSPKRIVFTEGTDARILEASARLLAGTWLAPILIGNEAEVKAAAEEVGFNIRGAEIIDPATYPDMDKMVEEMVALRRGTPLTEEQKKLITPERSDIVTVYRELQARRWHAEDLQPLCAKLGEENTGKTLVAVTALEQVGLIATVEKGGAKYLELVPAQSKKNLADAPVLKCLEGM